MKEIRKIRDIFFIDISSSLGRYDGEEKVRSKSQDINVIHYITVIILLGLYHGDHIKVIML